MLHLYFDGLCEPRNPGGVACYGWLLLDDDGVLISSGHGEVCRGPQATNNVAEYSALGFGLREMHNLGLRERLLVLGDSKLVIEQLAGRWECKAPHLARLRARCLELLDQVAINWLARWIPRAENERADALSREAYFRATGRQPPERSKGA